MPGALSSISIHFLFLCLLLHHISFATSLSTVHFFVSFLTAHILTYLINTCYDECRQSSAEPLHLATLREMTESVYPPMAARMISGALQGRCVCEEDEEGVRGGEVCVCMCACVFVKMCVELFTCIWVIEVL